MALLPTSFGTRPRLAIEVRPEGVLAARADEGSSLIAAASRTELPSGTSLPLLRPGATAHTSGTEGSPIPPLAASDRETLVSAVRKSLNAVCQRGREVTLVVPDSAARVLLLDFDELPGKPVDALPVVRFRLKKLLPFDADHAAVSYQVMSSARGLVRVLAVAMPAELLADYERIVRDAGFEPGAVLPSTLATLAALPEGDAPNLLVNVGREVVTTAILRGNLLLLHRAVDLRTEDVPFPEPVPAGYLQPGYLDPVKAAARVQTAELLREVAAEQSVLLTTAELAQAVSVAIAYFEDTLDQQPTALLAAGTVSAAALDSMLAEAGLRGIPVREIVDSAMLAAGTATVASDGRVNMGWLAGVKGALAS